MALDVNDEIRSNIGPAANGVAAGKEINQQITTVASGMDAIINHLLEMEDEIGTIKTDVKEAHVERADLIKIVNGLSATIDDIRQGIYPRWLQALMITMAAIMIGLTMLIWIKANALDDINWLAVTFSVSIAMLIVFDVILLVLFYRFRTEVEKRLHAMMIDIINRIDVVKYQKDKNE